jgi:8-oxo-dGTP pyrophosphatase MutT (NUDIX family)
LAGGSFTAGPADRTRSYPRDVIVHDIGDTRFHFRVAGVAYGPGGVLLQRVAGADHWFLPGGRVEMLEPSREALAREIHEELGARPHVGRLLWIIENFFDLDGRRFHELGLYFLIELPASIPTTGEFDAFDAHYRLVMQWLPLKDVPSAPVVPIFLRSALQNPPDVPVQVVNDEIGLWNASGPGVR